jgi:hypothetical protein
VEKSIETGFIPGGQYMALLIDEAHDFEEAWLRLATRMVSPSTQSLLVLYDDAQSIYQKKRRQFSLASVGIQAQGRTSILSSTTATPPRSWPWPAPAPSRCCNGRGGGGRPRGPASGAARQRRPARPHAGAHQRPRPGGGSAAAGRAHRRPGGRGRALNDVAALFRAKYQMAPLEQALKRAHIALTR